jgi:hypothetical protein
MTGLARLAPQANSQLLAANRWKVEVAMATRGAKPLLPGLSDAARSALVVATTSYLDPSLSALRAPAVDAAGFAGVLADPEIGGFDVRTVIDAPAQEVRIAIDEFLGERLPDDLVVVYVSCHGLKDLRRRLYFAATDTRKIRLASNYRLDLGDGPNGPMSGEKPNSNPRLLL